MARPRKVYDHPAWRSVRTAVLERDGHLCRVQLDGCQRTANTVDHIIAVADGGAVYDPANLRAACKRCNSALSAHRTNQRRAGTPSRPW